VGMEGEPLPEARLVQLRPGDLLLLCTDGLTGMLNDQQILSVLNEPSTLEARCRRLVDAANDAGGKDNVTVVLLAFEPDARKAKAVSPRAASAAIPVSKGLKAKATEKQ
jgi:PPM family protein phosphatase